MSRNSASYDVFLTYSRIDRGVGEVVRRAFEERGLRVFADSASVATGARWEEATRSAMAESRAFVAILSRASSNSSWITLELGAALAWGKAIYLLLEGITAEALSAPMSSLPSVPIARLREVVDEVERTNLPLSDDEAALLGEVYAAFRVPTDQLPSDPAALDRLSTDFNRRAGRADSPERVLQELLRLRKRGRLPKLKQKTA